MIKYANSVSDKVREHVKDNGVLRLPYSSKQEVWVSIIIGTDKTYKIRRKFIEPDRVSKAYKEWIISEGDIYCYCPSRAKNDKYYFKIQGGVLEELKQSEVELEMELLERGRGLIQYT